MEPAGQRYDKVSIGLHWLIGAGIVLVWLVESLRGELFPRGSFMRETLRALHEPAGLIVFSLILARALWRASHAPPEMPSDMKPWEALAARWTHRFLYVGMIAVPVLGVMTTFARGRGVNLGVIEIASPFGSAGLGRPIARNLKEAHEIAINLLLLLALAHAGAALWHHYVRKDDVLARMLPDSSRPT